MPVFIIMAINFGLPPKGPLHIDSVYVCVCVCEREREREREQGAEDLIIAMRQYILGSFTMCTLYLLSRGFGCDVCRSHMTNMHEHFVGRAKGKREFWSVRLTLKSIINTYL